MLAGITKAGFKVNAGIKDTGYLLLAKDRSGGHVFGASLHFRVSLSLIPCQMSDPAVSL